MDWAEAWERRKGEISGEFQPCGGDLADRADVVHEGDPDHVEFRGIRVAPHVLARTHDDLAEAVREQVCATTSSERRDSSGTGKLHLLSFTDFFILHGRHVHPLGTYCKPKS